MKNFYRTIIFTKTPLKTQFRYRDQFQITPIDSEYAPKSDFAKHFPLYLEYYIDNDKSQQLETVDSFMSDMSNQRIKEFEIMNLLTVLSNHRFFKYKLDDDNWGILYPSKEIDKLSKTEKDSLNNQTSSWVFSGYLYPNLTQDLYKTEFSDQTVSKTKLISPYYEYFTKDPIENPKAEITFPETIISCLDNYYKLSKKTSKKIISSTSLICDGIDIQNNKRSLAFLSYVSAIESFVSLENDEKLIRLECNICKSIDSSPYLCSECGKPIWGIKIKFKEFLKKFVSGTKESEAKFNKIYNLRCKITHQGQLFIGDYELSLKNMDRKESDFLTNLETLQLARLSLTNWLRYKNKASS